jgi:acyl-CoA thioesterase
MAKRFPLKSKGFHPFGELIGLDFTRCEGGFSRGVLEVEARHLNPHNVVHGGVIYALADTGMGGAVYSCLNEDELCATVEIKITYMAPVTSGRLTCDTRIVHRGKRIASLESEVKNDGRLVAKATGTYSLFKVEEGSSGSI